MGDAARHLADGFHALRAAQRFFGQFPGGLGITLVGNVVHGHDGAELLPISIGQGAARRQQLARRTAFRPDDHFSVLNHFATECAEKRNSLHFQRRGPVGLVKIVVLGPFFGR